MEISDDLWLWFLSDCTKIIILKFTTISQLLSKESISQLTLHGQQLLPLQGNSNGEREPGPLLSVTGESHLRAQKVKFYFKMAQSELTVGPFTCTHPHVCFSPTHLHPGSSALCASKTVPRDGWRNAGWVQLPSVCCPHSARAAQTSYRSGCWRRCLQQRAERPSDTQPDAVCTAKPLPAGQQLLFPHWEAQQLRSSVLTWQQRGWRGCKVTESAYSCVLSCEKETFMRLCLLEVGRCVLSGFGLKPWQ